MRILCTKLLIDGISLINTAVDSLTCVNKSPEVSKTSVKCNLQVCTQNIIIVVIYANESFTKKLIIFSQMCS